MSNVHEKMNQFRTWVDVDVNNSPIRKEIRDRINNDMEKSSPQILKEIRQYSPYRPHLSRLANTRLDCLKVDHTLAGNATALLACIKFKKLLKKDPK